MPALTHRHGRTQRRPARFELLTHWHLAAPIDTVWDELTHPERWPTWWPYMLQAMRVAEGAPDGLGAVTRLRLRSLIGYGMSVEMRTVEVQRPHRLRGRAHGEFDGEGLWELEADGDTTRVRYLWSVDLHRPWMRVLTPIAAPLFRWNHRGVMRAGGEGLARHLGVRLLSASAG